MINYKFTLPSGLQKRLQEHAGLIPDSYLFVNTGNQLLLLVERDNVFAEYPVSTSRFGIGNRENSMMTPPGIHRISKKIGAGLPSGRIFRDRKDTGENWQEHPTEDNLIVSRILRLEGLEPSVNQGPGIDSYERYIYIHGTNHEDRIGTPNSHGCVCMKNSDVIELFDTIPEGTIVIID